MKKLSQWWLFTSCMWQWQPLIVVILHPSLSIALQAQWWLNNETCFAASFSGQQCICISSVDQLTSFRNHNSSPDLQKPRSTSIVDDMLQYWNLSTYFSAQYFGATIVLLATSTALTVIVLNVYYRGAFGNEVPPFVQTVVLNWMARLMCLKKRVDDNFTPPKKKVKIILEFSVITQSIFSKKLCKRHFIPRPYCSSTCLMGPYCITQLTFPCYMQYTMFYWYCGIHMRTA